MRPVDHLQQHACRSYISNLLKQLRGPVLADYSQSYISNLLKQLRGPVLADYSQSYISNLLKQLEDQCSPTILSSLSIPAALALANYAVCVWQIVVAGSSLYPFLAAMC
jgi:mannitol-1-phosphate/altronate dehydrogenase